MGRWIARHSSFERVLHHLTRSCTGNRAMPTKASQKKSKSNKRSRQEDDATPGTDAKKVSRRRQDAAAFASKVRNAVESMQRGRSLTTLSEHTRVVTHQAIQNSIPLALRHLPSQRQKVAASLLNELAASITESLESLESPASWCVGKDYGAIAAENHRIEDSLVRNESHRLEMQEAILKLEKQLESEQETLDETRETTESVRAAASSTEMHPLLQMPEKKVSCQIDLDLNVASKQVKDLEQDHSDETEASCNAAAQHLAGIESRTSNALKYLEGVAMLKEKLSSVLSETNATA